MSESDDPESTIPWPGFVDILSTVIIVFVFFMMMTSVIIFVLSEQSKKNAVENAKKETQEQKEQKDSQALKEIKAAQDTENQKEVEAKTIPKDSQTPDVSNLLMQKDALEKDIAKLTQLKNVLSESQFQTIVSEVNMMTVHYGDMGSTITPDTEKAIRETVPLNRHITIKSNVPMDADFASIREIGLNRALNIRNVLLQMKIPNNQIDLKIVKLEENENLPPTDNVYGSVTLIFAQ